MPRRVQASSATKGIEYSYCGFVRRDVFPECRSNSSAASAIQAGSFCLSRYSYEAICRYQALLPKILATCSIYHVFQYYLPSSHNLDSSRFI